ncbi:chromosome partitioning protein [Naumannella cuiyingiana]|uniref:Chromosome partitioning protein n=1 Tax=Naumannella cuiyingiana TaxID=1347891 RepID=A0A7Z0DBZ2_9ACTN|nr:chromosome partitioning protein [Naumannella cuiyingiana]
MSNQKGGVGKTTTTVQLAAVAAAQGRRVLLVDADVQGNLSSVVAEVDDDQTGLADVLSTRSPDTIRDVITGTGWRQVDLVPTAGVALGAVRDELVIAGAGRELRLREAIGEVAGEYDLIVIDCAPALDQLTINALCAADAVAIITHTKLWSLNGLDQLLATIGSVQTYYNQGLRIAGVVVNQHEAGTVSGRAWLDDLRTATAARDLELLEPPIPKRVLISDATEAGRGLADWGSAEASELAQIYAQHLIALTREDPTPKAVAR